MKVGFIGCGNMGQAMLAGMLESGAVRKEEVIASAKTHSTKEKLEQEYHVRVAKQNTEVVREAEYIFLAVKPQYYESVLAEIGSEVTNQKVLISVAPGKTFAWLEEKVGKSCKIVRTMPNTPSLVREGMMGICGNENVTATELERVASLCAGFSKTQMVPESLMDVVTAVSGSAPAYVFLFIEAMADAAVEGGMPRAQAYTFAAQAVLGSAKMVLETGKHPGELKDMVCSPGGTTIQAVRVLEEQGMRAAVMDAVKTCIDKSRNM